MVKLYKGPFIATQLNSTRRRVELSCVAIDTLTDATQLNCRRRSVMQLTQLNSVQPISAKQVSRVELSCVAINGPLNLRYCFLPRDAMQTAAYAMTRCLSVCHVRVLYSVKSSEATF